MTTDGDQMGSKACVNVLASGPLATQMMVMLDDPSVANPFPKFPLPFDLNCRSMALSTLGGHARQVLIGGFGRWLPSHIVMQFREIQGLDYSEPLESLVANGLLVTAKSQDEFLEIFAMGEMMATCQDLSVDHECVVEYGHTLGSIEPDDNVKVFDTPKAHSLIKPNVDIECTSRHMVTIGVQSGLIVQNPEPLPCSTCAMFDHGVQTDIYIQGNATLDHDIDTPLEPIIEFPDVYQLSHPTPPDGYLLLEKCTKTKPNSNEQYMLSPESPEYPANDEIHNQTPHVESCQMFMQDDADPSTAYQIPTLTGDIPVSEEQDKVSDDEDIFQTIDAPLSPPLKSRLREKKKSNPTATTVKGQQRRAPSKPGQPVVFASQEPLPTAKGRANIMQKHLNKVTYTIDELLHESWTGTNSLTPFIPSFLLDPEGQHLLQ
ncbi:hypothetical protein BDR06DRAFT_1005324 [Suillus hirtellus]|nr:hypothetical protein BDR06DRAFT_1005324 [Suillus hirtellus]